MRSVITPPLVPQPKPAPQLRTWKRSKRKSKHLTARERRLLLYDQALMRDERRMEEHRWQPARDLAILHGTVFGQTVRLLSFLQWGEDRRAT